MNLHRNRKPIGKGTPALLLCAGLLGAASLLVREPARAQPPAIAEDFKRSVQPFLTQRCVKCHGAEKTRGDVRLDNLRAVGEKASENKLWQSVLDQLALGTMPPKGQPRPPREELETVARAIRQALGGVPDVAQLPGFGNYVDHQALFTEPSVRKAATPARLWRISPYIFREEVNRVAGKKLLVVRKNQGGNGLHPALPFLTPMHTFRDLSQPHGFEEATTELLVDMAWLVAGYQLETKKAPAALPFTKKGKIPADPYATAVRHQFGLVLQRDPEPGEVERLVALARRTEKEAGPREALRTLLAAVLVMPEAVFRVETGSGSPDAHGRVRLTPRENAFAVSYALTDDPPDEKLRAAIREGKLATAEGVRSEVERLLRDPNTPRPRVLRFFQEYFEYTRSTDVFKDGRLRKHYSPEQLVEDADFIVRRALAQDRQVLRTLLTTPEFYVNYAEGGRIGVTRPDRRQKWYYELFNLSREWDWQAKQPLTLPAPRSGILTHPAWLIAFSDNEKSQPIQRGRWVRMNLFGGTVPDVPIGVDAQLPTEAKLTLREKMHVTRAAYCWKCHQRMDPLGLPFEQFDGFGIHRTQELGRPVDTTGSIEAGVPDLDGPVGDPFEYLQKLATSRHVQQVFVRHAFRYWMGRNETLDDAPTLIDAERAYHESDGSMNALLASLLTSDSFLYRRLPAKQVSR